MNHRLGLSRRGFLRQVAMSGACGWVARAGLASAPEALPYFQDRGWQIGCWTRPWAQHDYRTCFDAIAEAGFRYVALTGAKTRSGRVIGLETSLDEARQVGEEARRRGLAITTVYGGNVPLEKGAESLRKMIDLCAAAGGWSVLLAHMGDEQTYQACCRTVAGSGQYAIEQKVAVVLKPHGGTTGTGPQLRDAVRRVGHPCFTIMYDPGNILYYSDGKLDPVTDCQAVLGVVTGISVKDFRPPKEVMLTPGTGQVDFAAVMKRLISGGLTHGPLMIETLAPGDLKQTLREARQAKDFVERLVAR